MLVYIVLILAYAVTLCEASVHVTCPTGYKLFEHAEGDVCLLLSTELMTNSKARDYCGNNNGVLLTIDTATKNAQAMSLMSESWEIVWIHEDLIVEEGDYPLTDMSPVPKPTDPFKEFNHTDITQSAATSCVCFHPRGVWNRNSCGDAFLAVCSALPTRLEGKRKPSIRVFITVD
jgi:hypothetical protein